MKNFKLELKDLYNQGKYDEIITLIDSTDPRFIDSELLVLKGDCIQLGENNPYELSHVEESYIQALRLDPSYVDAYMELGFFYYNVLDREKEAKNIFTLALLVTLGFDYKYLRKFSHELSPLGGYSYAHILNKYLESIKSEEDFKKLINLYFHNIHWGNEIESTIEKLLKEHFRNYHILEDIVKDVDTDYNKTK
ncbi:MAG: hypothetical protein JSS63_10915 [Bacteroidetes bacterium]|nr:hypothetical protein [Bacteroidota bacterium]MBX7046850.1 tetratricopeptide repeat protein [Ignavibacteria bacterium]